ERRVAVAYQDSRYSEHQKTHQGSQLSGETITLTGHNQVNIQGAALAAEKAIDIQGDNGVSITADKDIYQSDSTVGSRGGAYYNHHQENHETVRGTDIDAGET
ncbi:hemagglutinin repeat-containing protein, partial [Acetonema longum]|uniref:hemagglutinin repeat-containing protein n=1 Tax=Acetonema longum TaxID=2374 RepID=UPI00058E4370